tara:strand:- start:11869 stop:12171 length:303 start_codon:yes stop_codon:yes gene_type:complete
MNNSYQAIHPDPMRGAEQSILNQNPHDLDKGLTKREYFASIAMQGIISNSDTMREITKAFNRFNNEDSDSLEFGKCIGRLSLMYADGLLIEIENSNETKK